MKAREYAISKGLAKAGRGKLSAAAHTAIKQAIADGMQFDDYKDGKVIRNVATDNANGTRVHADRSGSAACAKDNSQATGSDQPVEIKSRPVTHEYSTIYGIDVRGRSPLVIAFQYCSKCIVQVRYCSHEHPELPEWIGGGPGFIEYPTQEQVDTVYKIAHPDD